MQNNNNTPVNTDDSNPVTPQYVTGTQEALDAIDSMFSDDNVEDISNEDQNEDIDDIADDNQDPIDNTTEDNGDIENNVDIDDDINEDNDDVDDNIDSDVDVDDDDNQDDDEIPEEFNDKQQKIFSKAIGKIKTKLKAKLNDTQSQLASQNEKFAELTQKFDQANAELVHIKAQGTPPPPVGNPLIGVIDSIEALQKYKESQFAIKEQILRNQNTDDDFVRVNIGGKQYELSVEDAQNENLRIDRFLNIDSIEIANHLKNQDQSHKWLNDSLPEIKNPTSKISIAIDSIIAKEPILKKVAGYKTAAFYLALGQSLASKMGGKQAWNFATSSQDVGQTKITPQRKPKPPPPIQKKEIPKKQGVLPQRRQVDGPLDQNSAADILAQRFGLQ